MRDIRAIAIGYCRVSSTDQAEKGVSLAAQEEKIRAMAVVQVVNLKEVIHDAGCSAKNLSRPGMERILAMVDKKEIDVVIIAKLDRITRSVKDLAELLERFEKRHVALVSVADGLDTKSAAGRLVLNIMVSVSQWEREAIGERTRDALQHKKRNGERVGTVPYGWKVGESGKLVVNPLEMPLLEDVAKLRDKGYSPSVIAARLNNAHWRTRSGAPWCREYVRNILKHTEEEK